MDDRLIKSGASAPGLIDDIRGDAAAHEVWLPAFSSVRSRFQTRSCVSGAVHHDDGRHVQRLASRYLKLDIHLPDHNLVRCIRLIGRGYRGILGDLRHATDEEAALILDDQRFREEPFRLVAVLRKESGTGQDKHNER